MFFLLLPVDIYLKAVCDILYTARIRGGTSNPQPITDYRETAAKFQKEWRVQKPHRDFPYARHVKSHALVSVINRGLLYYALERDHARGLVSPPLPKVLLCPIAIPLWGSLCFGCDAIRKKTGPS